jgi:hypothetical protein
MRKIMVFMVAAALAAGLMFSFAAAAQQKEEDCGFLCKVKKGAVKAKDKTVEKAGDAKDWVKDKTGKEEEKPAAQPAPAKGKTAPAGKSTGKASANQPPKAQENPTRKDQAKEKAGEAKDWTVDKAKKTGHWTKDKAKKAGHWTKDKAGDAGDYAKEKACKAKCDDDACKSKCEAQK